MSKRRSNNKITHAKADKYLTDLQLFINEVQPYFTLTESYVLVNDYINTDIVTMLREQLQTDINVTTMNTGAVPNALPGSTRKKASKGKNAIKEAFAWGTVSCLHEDNSNIIAPFNIQYPTVENIRNNSIDVVIVVKAIDNAATRSMNAKLGKQVENMLYRMEIMLNSTGDDFINAVGYTLQQFNIDVIRNHAMM